MKKGGEGCYVGGTAQIERSINVAEKRLSTEVSYIEEVLKRVESRFAYVLHQETPSADTESCINDGFASSTPLGGSLCDLTERLREVGRRLISMEERAGI